MSPEDMQRFRVEPGLYYSGEARLWLSCNRCGVFSIVLKPMQLAELVQRADEHTEVCR